MINFLLLVVLGVLILASYLDLKYKAVPSVILTSLILAVLLLRPDNLFFGVVTFVFAILIRDLWDDFGVADIKIFIVMGLLLTNFSSLMIMIIFFLIFQFVYVVVWKWRIDDKEVIAFIPCLLAVYIAMMLVGGLA